MPISLKLPTLDNNPILLAEIRTNKINDFIQKLPFDNPLNAANDLIEELQILNSQKVAFTNRLNALEIYRPSAFQIYQELLPHFCNASLPISQDQQVFADTAMHLWKEFAFGYKFALVDLQNKLLNLNSGKTTAIIVQRAIHALKEIALVHHLGYRAPPPNLWSELHQLYFCAIQQSVEKILVTDLFANKQLSSANLIYTQVLLMSLADPQHLAITDILKTDAYLSNVAEHAELRTLGLIEKTAGVFLIALDSDKPPIPYSKNRDVPDSTTDLLLLTLDLARQIHQHIKSLQNGILPSDSNLPVNAIENHYEDLLSSLIKNFGKVPQRVFSRTKKSDGIELGIGLNATHQLLNVEGKSLISVTNVESTIKPSRWQVLNASAGGYALRKFNSSQASAGVGDVVAMKNSKGTSWEVAVLRWANVNYLNQLDIGLELISPSAISIIVKLNKNGIDNGLEGEALLLPNLNALKQSASIITAPGFCKSNDILDCMISNKPSKIIIDQIIERTSRFERFQFSLI